MVTISLNDRLVTGDTRAGDGPVRGSATHGKKADGQATVQGCVRRHIQLKKPRFSFVKGKRSLIITYHALEDPSRHTYTGEIYDNYDGRRGTYFFTQ